MGRDVDPKDRIIVPLDVADVSRAIGLASDLAPYVGGFKIGLELISAMFASLVVPATLLDAETHLREIRKLFKITEGKRFWDGKFDDIPNTVGGASSIIAGMGVRFFNVHASAGRAAVRAAVEHRINASVLGVTVLTSLDEDECRSIFGADPGEKVVQFALMLADVGAQGIICSAQELGLLGTMPELQSLIKVIPGVRPRGADVGDQKRVMTPSEAIIAGADFLVIGRPITKPETGTPIEAAIRIAEEIATVK